MIFKCFVTTVLIVFVQYFSYSQIGYADNWHFGDGGTVNFTNGTPVSSGVSSIFAYEGSASFSDENGNLLFYTNGIGHQPGGSGGPWDSAFVWNRYHQKMPNGDLTTITGKGTPMQSSLVVPMPGSETSYYVFSMDGYENYGPEYVGLTYSIVDMSLDNGLGDVTVKGVPLDFTGSIFLAEQITATRHENGTDYWLVTHGSNTINLDDGNFYVYLISSSGISGPTVYTIGNPSSPGMQCTMQIAPLGDKLAFNWEIFNFDNATGAIYNPIEICDAGYREFSRSGRYLYISKYDYGVYQIDLETAGFPTTLLASSVSHEFAQLQMGPDGKIYIAMGFNSGFQPYLSVINQPEMPGTACDLVENQVLLNGGGNCRIGLPNIIDSDIHDLVDLKETERLFAKVTPNPFEKTINVSSEKQADFEILSLTGQVLYQGKVTPGVQSLNLSNLSSQVLILRFVSGADLQVERIIKL